MTTSRAQTWELAVRGSRDRSGMRWSTPLTAILARVKALRCECCGRIAPRCARTSEDCGLVL